MKNVSKIILCLMVISNVCGATTIAYWQFDEGSGQTVTNSEGSSSAKLQLGNSGGTDIYEPTWAAGLRNGAIKNNSYTENGNKATYCKNPASWQPTDAVSLAPLGSYSIEMLINPEGFYGWGTNVGGLIMYKDQTNGRTQYLMRTYLSGTGTKLLGFYSQHADGTNTNVTMDVDSLGLIMAANKWYYTAAIFDASTNNLQLIVRDMETGNMVSKSFSSKPMNGMAAIPNPLLYVGTEGTSRCFDGLLDEIKISDTALTDGARLYNIPEPATLAFLISGTILVIRRKTVK